MKYTHLESWLSEAYTHCQYGSKEWCEGYLNNALETIREQGAEIERLKARVSSLEAAIWDFKPSAQVAFLWQVNGAREGEVERYKDRYQALLTVLGEELLTPAPNAPMLPVSTNLEPTP